MAHQHISGYLMSYNGVEEWGYKLEGARTLCYVTANVKVKQIITTYLLIKSLIFHLSFTDHLRVAWYVISVVSVCMYVRRTWTFESLNVGSSFLQFWRISRVYGSSLYTKVIGSRSGSWQQKIHKCLFPYWPTLVRNFHRHSPDWATDHMLQMVGP